MEIVYDNNELEKYMKEAVKVSPEHPILVDKFLEDAIELDVDFSKYVTDDMTKLPLGKMQS